MESGKSKFFIGLICGTSLDGIDAVLVDLSFSSQKKIRILKSLCSPLDSHLVERLTRISIGDYANGPDPIDELGALHRRVGLDFAKAALSLLKASGVEAKDVRAIGSHGITVRHRPEKGFTMQIGDPNVIAAESGIDVVADFRGKDVALAGQGAPLACGLHRFAFGNETKSTKCVINVGGIANATVLRAGEIVVGFDTGPGNCLMDAWAKSRLGATFDADGAWAKSGRVNEKLLAVLFDEGYFSLPPPKSTGKELFNLPWLDNKLRLEEGEEGTIRPEDVQCTLAHFTAKSIVEAVRPFHADEIFICGGGAHNGHLMDLIADYHMAKVGKTSDLGVHEDWVEAAAFAWMASAYLDDRAANSPAVTGATRPAVIGALYKAA